MTDVSGILGRHLGPAPLLALSARHSPPSGPRPNPEPAALIRKHRRAGPDLDRLHRAVSKTYPRQPCPIEVGASEPSWSAEDAITARQAASARTTPTSSWPAPAPCRFSGPLRLGLPHARRHAPRRRRCTPGPRRMSTRLGWVGFDISNGISPDTRYVRVATGPRLRRCLRPSSGTTNRRPRANTLEVADRRGTQQ